MDGGFANGASTDPVMTPDGTCVAFISAATNLVAGDTNGIPDVFVRDLITQTTWLVSPGARSPSSSANPLFATPVITPDGRYVAVSYTHLDVYKRQASGWVRPLPRPWVICTGTA